MFLVWHWWYFSHHYYPYHNIYGIFLIIIICIMISMVFLPSLLSASRPLLYILYSLCPCQLPFLCLSFGIWVLMCFITCYLMICHFFISISVWETMLFLISSPWFIESIPQPVGCNNCLELLDTSIKGVWFTTRIDGNLSSCIYHIFWWEIVLCIIAY